MGVGVDRGSACEEWNRREGTADGEGHVLMEWPVWGGEGERPGRRIRASRYEGFEGDWRTVLEVRIRGDHWEERTVLGYVNDVSEIEIGEP